MAKKISIRLDARKQICLVYGSNGTKINLLPMLGVTLNEYAPNDFKTPIKGNSNNLLDGDTTFFSFANANKATRKKYELISEKLINFYNKCVEATNNYNFNTGKELFEFVVNGSNNANNTPTLIEYAEKVKNSYDTSNALCYNKLINRLKEQASTAKKNETVFASLNIETVNTDTFKEWCKYVGNNKDNIKCFRHVVYEYHKKENENANFKFNYSPEIKEGKAPLNTLSDKELHQLLHVNVDKVTMHCKSDNTSEQKTLYKDFICLLYYCFTRHIDLMLARVESFYIENGRMFWKYHAHKTLNTTDGAEIDTPIMYNEAVEIIQKYIGNRKSGYLFPILKESYYGWERLNSIRTHYNFKLNEFIQEVASTYNWENTNPKWRQDTPTCTTLRHTTFTNAYAKGIDTRTLALIGHTSTRQLERTYFNKQELAKKITKNMELLTI